MFLYGLLGTTYIFIYYLCVVYNNLIVKYQLCLNKLFSVSVSVSVSVSSTIKKLKTSYNSAFRNLILIKKPYSASTIFVAHGIPSFYEVLRTGINRFADRVSKNSNSIIMACMTPIVYIHSPIRQWWRSVLC